MLRAYFDESGHADDPGADVVAVGGCIAPLNNWERFEADWRRVLRHFCVSGLHMKDLAHSRGEFTGWSEPKRRAFLGALLEIMERDVSTYIGAATSLRLYNQLPHLHQGFGDPYHGCFIHCLVHAEEFASDLASEELVEIVCASHPEFSGLAAEIFARYQAGDGKQASGKSLSSIAFGSPSAIYPLQAADLVAYELLQFLTNRIRGIERARWPMQQIRKKGEGHLLNEVRLTSHCEGRLP